MVVYYKQPCGPESVGASITSLLAPYLFKSRLAANFYGSFQLSPKFTMLAGKGKCRDVPRILFLSSN